MLRRPRERPSRSTRPAHDRWRADSDGVPDETVVRAGHAADHTRHAAFPVERRAHDRGQRIVFRVPVQDTAYLRGVRIDGWRIAHAPRLFPEWQPPSGNPLDGFDPPHHRGPRAGRPVNDTEIR